MVIHSNTNGNPESENGQNEDSCDSSNIKYKSESATNILDALRKRKIQSMTNCGVDSLEILRGNIQYYFNEKINGLMRDFVETFFDPAIRNIKENTNETISEQQIKKICRDLLESCAKSQYSSSNDSVSSSSCSSFSRNTPEMNTSDSDTSENGATASSLLHQALKRKRTDSETEQLFKRQFFLTTAPPNHYYNTIATNVAPGKSIFRPTTSVLTSAPPKFISRPLQASTGIFNQTNSSTRPIFHIIQAPNRNLKLSATHVELCQLLQNNSNPPPPPQHISTGAEKGSTTSAASQTQNKITTSKEAETKN